MDIDLVAGLIGSASVGCSSPAQEHFARGSHHRCVERHDIRVGAVGILLAVCRRRTGAAVKVIGNGKGLVAGVIGIEGNIAENQGVEVEGCIDVVGSSTTPHSPASPGVTLGHSNLREVVLVDLGTVGNRDGLRTISFNGQICRSVNSRRGPLGVEDQRATGHGGAFPVEFRAFCAAFSGIPAAKGIVAVHTGGTGGLIVLAADIRFVVDFLNNLFLTLIYKGQIVLIPCVVEVYISTIVAVLYFLFLGESSNIFLLPVCRGAVSNSLSEFRTVNIVVMIGTSAYRLQHIMQIESVLASRPEEGIGSRTAIGCAAQQIFGQCNTLGRILGTVSGNGR